jgi:lactoylglutathione lyase
MSRHWIRIRRSDGGGLDGTLARLAEQGIEPEREPYRVREGGSRLCFVQDPDGYRVELIEKSG